MIVNITKCLHFILLIAVVPLCFNAVCESDASFCRIVGALKFEESRACGFERGNLAWIFPDHKLNRGFQEFCQEFVRNLSGTFFLQLVLTCVESPLRMTQEVGAADNEIDSDYSDSDSESPTKLTTAPHDTASPGRKKPLRQPPSKKVKFTPKEDDSLDQKKQNILDRYKNGAQFPPTVRGTRGEHISRKEYYKKYPCEKSSSITFTINGVPQLFKQQSILDAPYFDLPTYTTTDTSTRPDQSSTVFSGK